jgi:hypothetical protein
MARLSPVVRRVDLEHEGLVARVLYADACETAREVASGVDDPVIDQDDPLPLVLLEPEVPGKAPSIAAPPHDTPCFSRRIMLLIERNPPADPPALGERDAISSPIIHHRSAGSRRHHLARGAGPPAG